MEILNVYLEELLEVFSVTYKRKNKILFYTGIRLNGDDIRFELYLKNGKIILSDGGQVFKYYIKHKDCSEDFYNDFHYIISNKKINTVAEKLEVDLESYENNIFKAICVLQTVIVAIEKTPYNL